MRFEQKYRNIDDVTKQEADGYRASRKLAAAMMLRAFQDLTISNQYVVWGGKSGTDRECCRTSAFNWIMSDEKQDFSIKAVCEALDLKLSDVRVKAQSIYRGTL